MPLIADAQHAMVLYENRAANPPYRIKFGSCRRVKNRVSCWVHEEWDYIDAIDGTTVVLEADVKLQARKTRSGWKIRVIAEK